jgi:2-polyprenyl-6-methoxyphenol hydroxylase-like FAD-dependent oxidoreductase
MREYQLRRIPRTKEVVLRSRRLGAVAQFENPVLCWMRDSAMRLVSKRQTVRQMQALLGYEILTESESGLFR